MAVTLALALFSVAYLIQAWGLSVGTMSNPGPGAYPIGLGLFMLVCLGIQLFRDLRKKVGKAKGLPLRWQFCMGFASLGYAFLLEKAGYLVSTVLYSTVMVLLFELAGRDGSSDEEKGKGLFSPRSLALALATGAVITALGYLLFHVLFDFRLP